MVSKRDPMLGLNHLKKKNYLWYFIFLFFSLCDYLLSLFRFCPGVFSLEVLFLLELGSCEVFIFPGSPVCFLVNGLFSRTGLALELFAFKLSFSHLERRSVNESQEIGYLFIYLFFTDSLH